MSNVHILKVGEDGRLTPSPMLLEAFGLKTGDVLCVQNLAGTLVTSKVKLTPPDERENDFVARMLATDPAWALWDNPKDADYDHYEEKIRELQDADPEPLTAEDMEGGAEGA